MKIDPEFQNLIDPLLPEELEQLTKNIIADGCRDPLVVWGGVLIDGHNRFKICTENEIHYSTKSMNFKNRSQVKEWIIENQFGRRNISNFTRAELALELEDLFKEKAKENLKLSKGRGKKGLATLPKVKPENTREEVAKKAKVSSRTIGKVKTIQKKATPEQKKRLKSGEETINKIYNEIKKEEKKEEYIDRIKECELSTEKKYRVIYADPPWFYGNSRIAGDAKDHYSTMKTEKICKLPVKDLSEKDSVLFLWVTSPLLEDGLKVINEWGFKYKSSFVWDKVKHNFGFYNSMRHEFLLIATRGKGVPENPEQLDSVVSIEKTKKHSEKPEKFREIIDLLYPNGKRIELFSRSKHENWETWGNEV